MSVIHPKAQRIIDRLAAHTWQRRRINRVAVEGAVNKHLTELGLPPRPIRWFETAKDGYAAARGAAWGAARGAARDAARGAMLKKILKYGVSLLK